MPYRAAAESGKIHRRCRHHAGPISYSSGASGNVEVLYHPESNRISVKVLQAIFEVYFKIFGKKIHITDIDAAKFYKPEFEFAGPQPIQASVDVALPDSTKKTILSNRTDKTSSSNRNGSSWPQS